MKKAITLLLATMMCIFLCSCGKKDQFAQDYAQAYSELETLYNNTQLLSAFVTDVWEHMGSQRLGDTLAYMLEVEDDFEAFSDILNKNRDGNIERWIGIAYDWPIGTRGNQILWSWDQEKFHDMCMECQQLFGAVYEANEALGETIKTMRSEYGKRFSDDFAPLYDLYIEASTYAESCLYPAGTLNEFKQHGSNFTTSVAKLLKAADIY